MISSGEKRLVTFIPRWALAGNQVGKGDDFGDGSIERFWDLVAQGDLCEQGGEFRIFMQGDVVFFGQGLNPLRQFAASLGGESGGVFAVVFEGDGEIGGFVFVVGHRCFMPSRAAGAVRWGSHPACRRRR